MERMAPKPKGDPTAFLGALILVPLGILLMTLGLCNFLFEVEVAGPRETALGVSALLGFAGMACLTGYFAKWGKL